MNQSTTKTLHASDFIDIDKVLSMKKYSRKRDVVLTSVSQTREEVEASYKEAMQAGLIEGETQEEFVKRLNKIQAKAKRISSMRTIEEFADELSGQVPENLGGGFDNFDLHSQLISAIMAVLLWNDERKLTEGEIFKILIDPEKITKILEEANELADKRLAYEEQNQKSKNTYDWSFIKFKDNKVRPSLGISLAITLSERWAV